MTTKTCPHCGCDATNAIVLGDADPADDGLLECGCGAIFTERATRDGLAGSYYNPHLGINLFHSAGTNSYMSVPGASLI